MFSSRSGLDRAAESGFTLLEIVCVLAIIAIIAALALPRVPRQTTRQRLEAYAVETATLLKADRTAAIRRHSEVTTEVNTGMRSIRSGATGRMVRLPDDVGVDTMLPTRCNEHSAFSTISFFASGMSCGGRIALTRPGAGFEIRVNWLTGGVEIVAYTPT